MTIEEHYMLLAPRLTNWLAATGSSPEQAADLTQETFLRLWTMRERLHDDEAALRGLTFTIARNLRRNKVRDDRHLVFAGEIPDEAAIVIPKHSDARYLHRRVASALAALPQQLREAYTLFQIAELSVAEIARETHVTENLVKVRIHRAKCHLRKLLADLKA